MSSTIRKVEILNYINSENRQKYNHPIKEHNSKNNLFNAIILLNQYIKDKFQNVLIGEILEESKNIKLIEEAFILSTIMEVKNIIKPSIIFEYNLYIKEFENIEFNDFIIINTNENEWINYYFEKYLILNDIIKKTVDNSTCYYIQFCKHFMTDIKKIQKSFLLIDTELQHIELQKGDLHNNGQSVILLKFKSKDVYYKPKSLETEEFICSFVQKLNNLGLSKSMEIPSFITEKNRGWMEGVDYESPNSASKFYEFQGVNLCIFYFTNVKDLIADNIIVSKNFPNYYDLECIFQSTLKFNDDAPYEASSDSYKFLLTSVLSSNLLPEDSFYTENYQGLSYAGLSFVKGEIPIYTFENTNDKIVRILKNIKIENENYHLPKQEISTIEKTDNIIKGFKYAYNFFLSNKHVIVQQIKEILRDKKIKTRVLYRPTQVYSKLITESYLPQYLNSKEKRIELFNSLFNAENIIFNNINIIKSEIKQLKNGDIPTFYSYHNSKNLYDNLRKPIKDDFFNKSGLNLSLDKINLCSEKDLNRQINLIKLSFSIFEGYDKTENNIVKGLEYKIKADFENNISKEEINKVEKSINQILEKIENKSLKKDYPLDSYIDLVQTPRSTWDITSIPFGLFDGVDGYAFLYLNYFLVYNDSKILKKGVSFLNQGIKQFKNHFSYYKNISGFNKISLMNYPLSTFYVAEYYQENGVQIEELDEISLNLILNWIDEYYQSDMDFDVMGGGAGTILYLIKLYNRTNDTRALDSALKISDYLITNSTLLDNDTTCWLSTYGKSHTGFSHGSSGIAYAFASLSNVLDSKNKKRGPLLKQVNKALNFERNLFNTEERYWYFFRNFKENKIDKLPNHFWAYGSGAIAQSRILLQSIYLDPLFEEELNIAINNIKKYGFLGNFNYSSGVIGNIDLLNSYANLKNDKNLYQNIITYINEMYFELNKSNNSILACSPVGIVGNSIFWEMNGLFTGLAGVANTYLNVINYEKTKKLFQ